MRRLLLLILCLTVAAADPVAAQARDSTIVRLADSIRALARTAVPSGTAVVPDSACRALAAVNLDSLSRAHLASTTYTGYQTRARARVDSLLTAQCITLITPPAPPDTGAATIELVVSGPEYTPHYQSGTRSPVPGTDTVTVCATVRYLDTGAIYLGRPALRIRLVPNTDSVTVGVRGGNAMALMCPAAIAAAGGTVADTIPVGWSLLRIQVADSLLALRPVFGPLSWPP